MPRITKRTVDALKPKERERVVWDDDLKGFGVRVHPSGRKVFIVKTRHRGRVIKMTIGPCTVVSATYARVARRRDHHRREGREEPRGAQLQGTDHA